MKSPGLKALELLLGNASVGRDSSYFNSVELHCDVLSRYSFLLQELVEFDQLELRQPYRKFSNADPALRRRILLAAPVQTRIESVAAATLAGIELNAQATRLHASELGCILVEATHSDGRWHDSSAPLVDSQDLKTHAWIDLDATEPLSEHRLISRDFVDLFPTAGAMPCTVRGMALSQRQEIESVLEESQVHGICIASEILFNVRHICFIDYADWELLPKKLFREIGTSMSRHQIPGAIFLSEHAFESRRILLESLFHEALHRKLGYILRTRDILKRNYSAGESPKFDSPWARRQAWNTSLWPFDRVLDAWHVYAHLVVLYLAMQDAEWSIDPLDVIESRLSECFERYVAIDKWIDNYGSMCWGTEGKHFFSAVRSVVQMVDTEIIRRVPRAIVPSW